MSQNNELFDNKNTSRLTTKTQVKIQQKVSFHCCCGGMAKYLTVICCLLSFVIILYIAPRDS